MRFLLLGVSVLALAGCAITYQPPDEQLVENSIVVPKSFDESWEDLLEFTSQTFFAIDNLERDSGFINLNFTPTPVTDFADCGFATVPNNPYNPASPFEGEYVDYIVSRFGGRLAGTMNILLQPAGESRTEVSVNARYVLSHPPLPTQSGVIPAMSITFGTNQPGSISSPQTSGETRTCFSTGEAEELVLNAVR